ncbi:exocyst complex component 5-like [Tropilaelaps mercedesae]|uniref:Exocyst complex component 5-like n=1 Tax=Tropilaelaps mercedesae TaxID=418985 RepID=A0A1V9X782_9ACAR|nr:exocyst complex component 5-like [Tropilaelaps mercedesae]
MTIEIVIQFGTGRVAAKVVHLSEFFDLASSPRVRIEKVEKFMLKHVDFLGKVNDVLLSKDNIHEYSDLIQKLHVTAQQLPSRHQFDKIKARITVRHSQIEGDLTNKYRNAHEIGNADKFRKLRQFSRLYERGDAVPPGVTQPSAQEVLRRSRTREVSRWGTTDMQRDMQAFIKPFANINVAPFAEDFGGETFLSETLSQSSLSAEYIGYALYIGLPCTPVNETRSESQLVFIECMRNCNTIVHLTDSPFHKSVVLSSPRFLSTAISCRRNRNCMIPHNTLPNLLNSLTLNQPHPQIPQSFVMLRTD